MKQAAKSGLLILVAIVFVIPLVAFQSDDRSQPSAPRVGDSKVNPKDGLRYRWIPPGTYTSGCSPGDKQCYKEELPNRHITLTRGFWLGETEVPQSAWERVMPEIENPSNFTGPDLPVEEVTYNDADAYCQTIGGRLPTEAEWEYAARAGSTSSRYGDLDKIAWYFGNSKFTTHPVGRKQANAFGLHDMLGNVIEWTNTFFTVQLSQETSIPRGPVKPTPISLLSSCGKSGSNAHYLPTYYWQGWRARGVDPLIQRLARAGPIGQWRRCCLCLLAGGRNEPGHRRVLRKLPAFVINVEECLVL